jgi:endonuclease/exonuclease/phosphatase family metal-dependent hydrolase
LLTAGLVVLAAWALGWRPAEVCAAEEPKAEQGLCVMTFNLRYASATPPNAWPQRRPVMRACIEKVNPDLIGTQEGLYQQLKDLAVDLPAYEWIGLGRDGGSRGEFMAIFYRGNRFEPREFDHFWLSDTPEVVASTSWGNGNRRMVTWVRFLDRQTRQEFYFWNTHLDHAVQLAREKGAQLIRERVDAVKTTLPVLLVGDFNAVAGANRAYDLLVTEGGFKDTWTVAAERRNEDVNSFHDFTGPKAGGQRIDWILSRGPVTVQATELVTFAQGGQYPSDHFPVVAWLRLGQ